MVNKVTLIGRLGMDPELKHSNNGKAVLHMTLATWENRKVNEEWQEETVWHNIDLWGTQAESLGQYLHKGSMIFVEGSIRNDMWEDKEGNKRYKTFILAHRIKMLDKKED